MKTLADLTLSVARQVTEVTDGTATAGTTSSLTDTSLTQANGTFTNGTLWIRSGTHAGKVFTVTSHLAGVLSFATVTGAIAAGVRYSLIPETPYPYKQIVAAINSAMDDDRAFILAEDATLTGDGETLEFSLPEGVYNVVKVTQHDPGDTTTRFISTHWREQGGKLRFDNGVPPFDGWVLHLWSQTRHAEFTTYSDQLDASLNAEWIKWRACVDLYLWAMRKYHTDPPMKVEELLNMALKKSDALRPRLEPLLIVRTAGQ